MNISTKIKLKKGFANFFGGLGYLSCTLQWLLAIVLYFSFIEAFVLFINPNTNNQVTQTPVAVDLSLNTPTMFFAVAITVIMVLFTLYIIYKIPSIIVKAGKKVVHQTAESITPLVLQIQHKKDTKKSHLKLSFRIILAMKIILITTPVILVYMSQFLEKQIIQYSVTIYAGLWLAGFSIIFFVFQYLFAGLLSVKKQDLW